MLKQNKIKKCRKKRLLPIVLMGWDQLSRVKTFIFVNIVFFKRQFLFSEENDSECVNPRNSVEGDGFQNDLQVIFCTTTSQRFNSFQQERNVTTGSSAFFLFKTKGG